MVESNGSSVPSNGKSSASSKNQQQHTKYDNAAATPMSNANLEALQKQLQEDSASHSQLLTQKLATSQSGQNLLHMGSSLSSLPPDLHALLQNLHPCTAATEGAATAQTKQLDEVLAMQGEIVACQRRTTAARTAVDQITDLTAAEQTVLVVDVERRRNTGSWKTTTHSNDSDEIREIDAHLDHAAALERAAHVALYLVEELAAANETFTAAITGQQDTEHEQFLVKLAPRIRRLESECANALQLHMEAVVVANNNSNDSMDDDTLVILGHCMRGLALLGRASSVERIFSKTAIMPIVRPKISMGRLDEGGARGECAGLSLVLTEIVTEIANEYSDVLRLAESTFEVNGDMDVDLVTASVWVPIVTALMADPGIKMAIFSPGIASILQANYMALDSFMAALAQKLLSPSNTTESRNTESSSRKYYQPDITSTRIQSAQERIYAHPKTTEFSKKWNLPIYYQLRFGESCVRLNKAIDDTKIQGWIADVFTGKDDSVLRTNLGFELTLFLELYDTLLNLWYPDVILRPLTNRFLRGAVQLVARTVAFIDDGMEGKIMFGEELQPVQEAVTTENGSSAQIAQTPPPSTNQTRKPYCWGDSEGDVAAVAWELTILESTLRHDYSKVVTLALSHDDSSDAEKSEIDSLVSDVLKDTSDQIEPVVDKAWNNVVVKILTQKCSAPLAAVKGVAATYRMTNRPPPSQASPFVSTILRPLKDFDTEFANRTPDRIGAKWKHQVVVTVADRYASAVDDLIATVQRTEVALKNRKARRSTAGGMSDGEKVKLQLYLDYESFSNGIREVGVEPASVIGLSKLGELTAEGEKLRQKSSGP